MPASAICARCADGPGSPHDQAIRPLIAGNWKMNGLKASMAEFEAMIAGAPAIAGQGRSADLPAGDADLPPLRQCARARKTRDRRAGLPRQGLRRPYRRYLRRDAGRCRRHGRHRRPFRAARRSWRDRRGGAAKAEAAWRAGLMAIVCIGETQAAARGRADARRLRRPACRLAAGRRDGGQSGGRLRAGLGDRHRPDADRRRMSSKFMTSSGNIS